MDHDQTDKNEFNVNEGALWHTTMDLYYGYQLGEVVEIEHEVNKYWLATVEYCFKHLLLLKWVGEYGEFWVDTSMQNSNISSNNNPDDFTAPKKLSPPGYHLQSQLKSQFILERPTRILITPSLYNPANDPYGQIETIDDLLTLELDDTTGVNGYTNQTSTNIGEHTSLVLAKCTTKIAYGQDDVDELEAALQNLNDLDEQNKKDITIEQVEQIIPKVEITDTDKSGLDIKEDPSVEILVDKCKKIQESAIAKGRYLGVDENSKKVFYLKPKQFFDIGGANQERVFVPGTLLEVCHAVENDCGLELCHWFATVIKNTGGRLTLRWFLSDQPKFKQGRLELKSIKSDFIREEEASDSSDCTSDVDISSSQYKIPVKNVTFCMHYCNPSIHTISHAKSTLRAYRMPTKMFSAIEEIKGSEAAYSIEQAQMDFIFDSRRINLDKDRPMVDHLLSFIRWQQPQYINLTFAPRDKNSRREVLLSTPRTTKLVRGYIKSELEAGVFEVNSGMAENGEIIKFIYPYDSSYTVLPLSWADCNQDCLSVEPSRNTSPMPNDDCASINQTELNNNASTHDDKETFMTTDQDKLGVHSDVKRETAKFEPVEVGPFNLLCEIAKTNLMELDYELNDDKEERPKNFDELEPTCWSQMIRAHELRTQSFFCSLDERLRDYVTAKFKVMDQIEVVHPSSDATICLGRIRKVVYPLLWIQISADSYILLPFNSTDIYPNRWCESYNHPLISLLPPRKRLNKNLPQPEKKQKRTKNSVDEESHQEGHDDSIYEKEHFDLKLLSDKQSDIDHILNEKTAYIKIYFNHKCFTGPSLSKGKICSLPQYVGPGPLRLVMEEVVTKVISVAYVPPRILNDLSSKTFNDLLIARNLTNTTPMEFKAKYQKRVHREDIPVCLNPDDIAAYCECVCEHLKCCYNLFGPNLYDGDDCPGHCRALTKSNKFMKRATYYREKARLGEFMNDGVKKANNGNSGKDSSNKSSRPRYNGRESSESVSSSLSRSDQVNSIASSMGDDLATNELKENLVAVDEIVDEEEQKPDELNIPQQADNYQKSTLDVIQQEESELPKEQNSELDKILHPSEQINNVPQITIVKPSPNWLHEAEFNSLEDSQPQDWTIEDVGTYLDWFHLSNFKNFMSSEGVDGQALLLLDRVAIKEHLQQQPKSKYTQEEVGKLCRFVEFLKTRVAINS